MLADNCDLNGTPAFFWLRGCKADDIKAMLADAITRRINIYSACDILSVGSFLGKGAHTSLVTRLGEFKKRLAPAELSFPAGGPRSCFRADSVIPRGDKASE